MRQVGRPTHGIEIRKVEIHRVEAVLAGLTDEGAKVRRRAEFLTFARAAVVGGEHDDRVVPLPHGLEVGPEPAEVLVDVVDHPGEDLHVAGEDLPLVVAEVVPRLDGMPGLGIARRKFGVRRNDPHLELTLVALPTDLVPASVVHAAVLLDVVDLRLQRRMDGTVGEVHEEGFGGMRCPNLVDHVDRLIGEVVGEVVVVGVLVDRNVVVVLVEPVWLMEVREAVEDPVVPLETLLQRPTVARTGIGEMRVLAEVPFADHERGPAVVAEQFGHRDGVATQFMGVAGEAGIAVSDVPHARHVVVEAGEHRGARRRAHRIDMEVGVAHTTGSEGVEVGRVDLGAVAGEVGEPEIVGQHHDDVGRTSGRRREGRPGRFGRREDPSDLSVETVVGLWGVAHECRVWLRSCSRANRGEVQRGRSNRLHPDATQSVEPSASRRDDGAAS